MNIDLSTDVPPSPGRTLQLADTLAEIVRVLNHATRDHAALEYPAEADTLIRSLHTAASRLPQLLGQLSGWLAAEQEAGRVRITGRLASRPGDAVIAARMALTDGEAAAADLQRCLARAASVTSTMGAA